MTVVKNVKDGLFSDGKNHIRPGQIVEATPTPRLKQALSGGFLERVVGDDLKTYEESKKANQEQSQPILESDSNEDKKQEGDSGDLFDGAPEPPIKKK